jgi:Uma2 family endonuclease
MVAEPAPKYATYQDVLDAPEHLIAEVINGSLYTQPRPAAPHAQTASVLAMDLGTPFHRGRGGPGGWVILYEPELHLGRDILVPDLAGWRRERMPEVPSSAYFELAPDWVCEVLSSGTHLRDRRDKLPIYAREAVPYLWLVDPLAHSVEVFVLDGSTYRCMAVHGEDEQVRLVPFEAVELELKALWTSPTS